MSNNEFDIKLIKLSVYTDHEVENGISSRIINRISANIEDGVYCGNGWRIAFADFEKPHRTRKLETNKIHYDIWTTEANSEESIKKCVELIINDFEKSEINRNGIKEAVNKAKTRFK